MTSVLDRHEGYILILLYKPRYLITADPAPTIGLFISVQRGHKLLVAEKVAHAVGIAVVDQPTDFREEGVELVSHAVVLLPVIKVTEVEMQIKT